MNRDKRDCKFKPFHVEIFIQFILKSIWHRFILPLPTPFRMVKKNFFEVNQNKFGKLSWLLKFDTAPNETESVLFLTKN